MLVAVEVEGADEEGITQKLYNVLPSGLVCNMSDYVLISNMSDYVLISNKCGLCFSL